MARKQGTEVTTAAPRSPAEAEADRGRDQERHELRAPASAAEPEEIGKRAHGVRFELTCDIAYHAIREQFLARLNRLLTGAQVLLGTSAVAALVSAWPESTIYLVAVSAVAGVMLLIIDPAGAARDHRACRTRLSAVHAGIEEFGETEASLRSARAARMRVAGEAPPAYRAVSALAYNSAINAIYPEKKAARHRYKIGFWRRLAANWLPMRGAGFKKECPEDPGKRDGSAED